MLICEYCGQVYDENDIEPCVERTYVGSELVHEEEYYGCDCGGMIVPAVQCGFCGEYCTEDDLVEDICRKCLDEQCTYENVIEMGIECTENYELNGFLASVFSPREIEAILQITFEKMPKQTRDEYIEKYFNEDEYFSVSWLKERGFFK